MTDQRLRNLERAHLLTPSAASEAALLRGRVRAGALTPDLLELAAYCGHLPAIDALSPTVATSTCKAGTLWAPPGVGLPLDRWAILQCWSEGLAKWGQPAMVRAVAAAGRAVLRTLPCGANPHRQQGSAGRWYQKVGIEPCGAGEWERCDCDAPRTALTNIEAWIVDPSVERARICLDCTHTPAGPLNGWWVWGLASVYRAYDCGTLTPHLIREAWEPAQEMRFATLALDTAGETVGRELVRSVAAHALVRWSLGEHRGRE